jgi:general secretion pathway protein C
MQRLSHSLSSASLSELPQLVMEGCARAGVALRRIRPSDMTRIIVGAEVALTMTIAVIAGRMVWTVLEPPAWASAGDAATVSAAPRRAALAPILTDVDPFHRAASGGQPVLGAAVSAPETMLNLQLFGIRAGQGGSPGSAIVATPDNVQGVFVTGQEIMPGVRLEQILPDRIVIRRNGVTEGLSFDRDKSAQMAEAPPAYPAPAAAPAEEPLRRLDVDVRALVTALKVRPAERGGARGLLLEGSADPSVLEQTGLEPGDLLVSVNGTPAGDVGALSALAASGALRLTLEIERKGQRKFHRLAIDRVQ